MWVRCGGVVSNPAPHTRAPNPTPTITRPQTELSRREREAVRLLAQGLTSKQAAHRMGITQQSFGKAMERARFRLDVATNAQAVAAAAARRIVELPDTEESEKLAMTADLYETLKLVAQGLSNRQVGERLGFSEETVRDRVKRLLAYFDARNRVQLVALCHRERIV